MLLEKELAAPPDSDMEIRVASLCGDGFHLGEHSEAFVVCQ